MRREQFPPKDSTTEHVGLAGIWRELGEARLRTEQTMPPRSTGGGSEFGKNLFFLAREAVGLWLHLIAGRSCFAGSSGRRLFSAPIPATSIISVNASHLRRFELRRRRCSSGSEVRGNERSGRRRMGGGSAPIWPARPTSDDGIVGKPIDARAPAPPWTFPR